MKNLTIVLCVFALFLGFSANGYSQGIKTGLWEVTTTMEMPGMPSNMTNMMNKISYTYQQCLSSENPYPEPEKGMYGESPSGACKVIDSENSGNNIRWVVECINEGKKTIIKGNITYNGDTFEGTTKVEGTDMPVVVHMKGRRIGDCKE